MIVNIEIKEKKENKLLSRVELTAHASFHKKATPSGQAVKESIAKALGTETEMVVVKNIHTSYGTNTATISAYHYSNKDVLQKLEPQLFKKEKDAKAAPAAEAK